MDHEFDAEIFSTGTWNGDRYTDEDLEEMVRAFNELKGAVKPPVKLGHKDGQPALGWVKGLRKAGNKLIATLTHVPDIVKQAIDRHRYRRVSSEVYWNFKHGGRTFRRVLSGVALLGAEIPAVNNLADLQTFFTGAAGDLHCYTYDPGAPKFYTAEEIPNTEKRQLRNKYEASAFIAKRAEELQQAAGIDYQEAAKQVFAEYPHVFDVYMEGEV